MAFTFCCELEEVINETGSYIDGKKEGKWISYLEDGQIWYEESYTNGIENGEFTMYGYGNYTIFHKLKLENKADGKLNGKSIHYHINGEISRIVNFINGKQNGTDIFFDKNGNTYWSGNYKDGVLTDGDYIKSDKPLNLY
jgi:uncharacterized protein